jgi:peptidoglycan/LPS O-acetylase OafA/YrhL
MVSDGDVCSLDRGMSQAKSSRLPALDGLRAISILLVLLGHTVGTRNFPLQPGAATGALAGYGVRVFFVISGFLITTLLVKEFEKTGTISLKGFYIRRTYRIFPAFYAYLAVIAALSFAGVIKMMDGDMLAAATYTMNYHRPRAWYLGHLWSLSVEEQFYLLWPAIVLLLERKNAIIIAGLAILAAPMLRVALWILMPANRLGIGETFPTVFDALAVGCLLAGIRDALAANRFYSGLLKSPLFVFVPILGLVALFVPRVSFDLLVGQTIQNVTIAMTVDWAVRQHETPVGILIGRLLDAAPIAWIGRLSYSLYLWQQAFINRTGTHWVQSFPINLVAAFVMAVVSYYLIEQPILRLRDRSIK